MSKKKRCFYLDFVRALAVVSILLTHYNANYLYMNSAEQVKKAVITTKVANIYIGDFGVALFLIISGAALMYTYDEQLELKTFFIKRFRSIYPMFWIAYVIFFICQVYISKGLWTNAPKWTFLLTLLGMDGYIGTAIPTYYLIGEWFLGFIIISYLLFPVLRWGVKEHPAGLVGIIAVLYFHFMFYYNIPFLKNIFLFIRLPEIVFGMIFVKYIKRVKLPLAVICTVILVFNGLYQPKIDPSMQMTYVGISAFLLLAYVSSFLEKSKVLIKICKILSKYSYAIFLTHHFIITWFAGRVNMADLSILQSYLFFIGICIVIGISSKILYVLDDRLERLVKLK